MSFWNELKKIGERVESFFKPGAVRAAVAVTLGAGAMAVSPEAEASPYKAPTVETAPNNAPDVSFGSIGAMQGTPVSIPSVISTPPKTEAPKVGFVKLGNPTIEFEDEDEIILLDDDLEDLTDEIVLLDDEDGEQTSSEAGDVFADVDVDTFFDDAGATLSVPTESVVVPEPPQITSGEELAEGYNNLLGGLALTGLGLAGAAALRRRREEKEFLEAVEEAEEAYKGLNQAKTIAHKIQSALKSIIESKTEIDTLHEEFNKLNIQLIELGGRAIEEPQMQNLTEIMNKLNEKLSSHNNQLKESLKRAICEDRNGNVDMALKAYDEFNKLCNKHLNRSVKGALEEIDLLKHAFDEAIQTAYVEIDTMMDINTYHDHAPKNLQIGGDTEEEIEEITDFEEISSAEKMPKTLAERVDEAIAREDAFTKAHELIIRTLDRKTQEAKEFRRVHELIIRTLDTFVEHVRLNAETKYLEDMMASQGQEAKNAKQKREITMAAVESIEDIKNELKSIESQLPSGILRSVELEAFLVNLKQKLTQEARSLETEQDSFAFASALLDEYNAALATAQCILDDREAKTFLTEDIRVQELASAAE